MTVKPSAQNEATLQESTLYGVEAHHRPDLTGNSGSFAVPSYPQSGSRTSSTEMRPYIIWADENADMSAQINRLLGNRFDVETVTDGAAALKAAQVRRPDLVLGSVTMPRLDGPGLLRSLRADVGLSETPFILVTAQAGEEGWIEGLEAGADDYLIKPFGARELLTRVETTIRMANVRRKMDRALRASEDRYRAIVESQVEMVCRFRPDGTILFVNGAYARARNTTPEILSEANFWDFIAEEDRPAVRALLDQLRPESPQIRIENRFETAEGVRWTLWTNHGLAFDSEGHATEVQSSGIDITDRKQAEQALRDSQAKLSAIVDHLPVGVGMVDMQGRTLSLNPAGLRLHGFTSLDEMLTQPDEYQEKFDLLYLDGRLMPMDQWPLIRALRGDYVHEYEVALRRHLDGEPKIVAYSAVPVLGGEDGENHIIFMMLDITERKKAEAALRTLNESLEVRVEERTHQVRTLASRLTMAEQEERRRISQILHDDLQQLLYGVEMKMDIIRQDLQETEHLSLAKDLNEGIAWLKRAISTTRQLTVDLSPPILQNEGLVNALEWLQHQMRDLHGLTVTIQAEHRFYLPNEDLRVLLFQIVRELLFNVKKHAGTNQATVELSQEANQIHIRVSDQGKGFQVPALTASPGQSEGFGLYSIRERLSLLGGHMEICSAPGEGTQIDIVTPYN